jgi:hypothetical protein
MNQKYKDKYEELRNNDIGQKEPISDKTEHEFYETPGNSRMITFAWQDGRKLFMNYAYLVCGELIEDGESSIITLTFTTHTISLKGHLLENIFVSLIHQNAKILTEIYPRYKDNKSSEQSPILEILVKSI